MISVEKKVRFLRNPESYPEVTAEIEAIETHFAWVFLTDRHAYKFKKPVRLDRMDFRTLERRRSDCEAELCLNRRLTEGIYLDLVALTADSTGRLTLEGDGEPVEWLVKMRRLDSARMLDRALAAGTARPEHIGRAIGRLCRFFRSAPALRWDGKEYLRRLRTRLDGDLDELQNEPFALPRALIESVRCGFEARLDEAHAAIGARAEARRLIEGHGDLRPEHIWLGEPVQIIDCLEFDRELRCLDTAEDVAFLALECRRAGYSWAAERVILDYREQCADRIEPAMLQFYTAARATARAKVAARHVLDPRYDREQYLAQAREYLGRAEAALRAASS